MGNVTSAGKKVLQNFAETKLVPLARCEFLPPLAAVVFILSFAVHSSYYSLIPIDASILLSILNLLPSSARSCPRINQRADILASTVPIFGTWTKDIWRMLQ